ncbi:ectoine/hydroxyectoine ABC transporter permease subunit EhuD [Pseudomonas sp. SZMC_28357]|uniref:ectoine/hydroxyectoine ABC transporter permease subunit EhuD n=1 Tax=Pseudomonas sp. SZMC_28357 TaxID=3074380 RepID=UPI002871D090|nr:ectoine/hydroxyectoine ABC transporter permease subunit EhuD [Pseudomonas sp. SZMC_28357]MDR9752698.1 ectoine/hydroxyectoine ABC transporter permease subunit EhuD [Pseudomonas sp. SZMC_28357]
MTLDFSWSFAAQISPALARGAGVAFIAAIGGFFVALLVGAVLAGLQRSKRWWLALTGRWLMELLRSTPLLIQVYFLFFVLPGWGIVLEPVTTGVVALGLYHGAYVAEAYRAVLDNLPAGQWDAAHSLRFSRYHAYRYLMLPQMVLPLTPALGNTFITMLKDTPILAAVSVPELMFAANDVGAQSFRYVEPITLAALAYLFMSGVAALVVWLLRNWIKGRYQ